jgi:hypothetical protein
MASLPGTHERKLREPLQKALSSNATPASCSPCFAFFPSFPCALNFHGPIKAPSYRAAFLVIKFTADCGSFGADG